MQGNQLRRSAAIEQAVARWSAQTVPAPSAPPPLPKHPTHRSRRPGRLSRVVLRATAVGLVVRLAQWLWLVLALLSGMAWDVLRLRANAQSRARRVRITFQRAGGTLVKLGQQLSLRADLLPYEVCDELRQLLDRAEPIPWEVARAKVCAQVGKLEDVFASFDREPIGSASVACVYRAVRRDGRVVAVKVLRPHAREVFGADLWLLHLCLVPAEWLMLLRPGQAANLVQQLRTMFEEELDLRSEARYQELFRAAVRKTHLRYLSAPAIHFDLSGSDVLISDHVEGLPCDRVLAAVEEGDTAMLQRLAGAGIDPRMVAKRLLKAWNWQVFQFPIFHGDPHPANILVLPGGHLVLVDFGACSYFSDRGRMLLRKVQLHMLAGDFRSMASAAMGLLEPYPPIDVDKFGEELELLYARYLHAAQSDHAEWWERATSKIWLDFIQLARKHMIPVSLDTLRLFRATFLLDTVVFRLAPDLKLAGVYKSYLRQESRWLERRYRKRGLVDRSGQPLLSAHRLQTSVALFDKIAERLSGVLESRSFAVAAMPGKAFWLLATILRGLLNMVLVAATVILGAKLLSLRDPGGPVVGHLRRFRDYLVNDSLENQLDSWADLANHPVFEVVILVVLLLWLRRVRIRLTEVGDSN